MELSQQLEFELERIVDELDIPAVELLEGLVDIATTGNWHELAVVIGEEKANAMRSHYETNPALFRSKYEKYAHECRRNMIINSSKRLARLSRINLPASTKLTLTERIQNALDSSGQMLEFAFAYKFIELLDSAVARAVKLRELVVNEASSDEADKYLAEACECFYFGLPTASVLMCRSLLEEVLEGKLPQNLIEQWRSEAKARNLELTLGTLLHKVNNHSPMPLPSSVLPLARRVNEAGRRGAHPQTVTQQDALDCLQNTRAALVILLGPSAESSPDLRT